MKTAETITVKEAIDLLEHANAWRRGADTTMPHPEQVGLAIDTAVNVMLKHITSMEHLEALTIEWAQVRGLLSAANTHAQALKTVEEVGELAAAILKQNAEGTKDAIGDVIVTLAILAAQNGLTLNQCFAHAWAQIRNRTGKTVNGTFIKDNN